MRDDVRLKAERMDVYLPTGASADMYRRHAEPLVELEKPFPVQPGQAGALLALGGDLCLDFVSRPDAFERLYPKILRGYLLDALERLDGQPSAREQIDAFVESVRAAGATSRPSVGLGQDIRLEAPHVTGSGLELAGEVPQLSASSNERQARTFGRIARPSRRR